MSCIRILDDMIEYVSQSAPALAPLFRSQQQLRILAELFGSAEELPIGELAKRAGVAQATASREADTPGFPRFGTNQDARP